MARNSHSALSRIDIVEACDCSDAKLEGGRPVLKGVKVVGLTSLNRRRYLKECLEAAIPLYESIKVNFDHPAGNPDASRDFDAAFGRIRNVSVSESGMWGDLHYNPEHPRAKQFLWFAKNDPARIGLSHNAVGDGREVNGEFVVEKIIKARSVDIVGDPATTRGLQESCCGMSDAVSPLGAAGEKSGEGHEDHLINAITAVLRDKSMDGAAKRKKVNQLIKVLDSGSAKADVENTEEGADTPHDPDTQSLAHEPDGSGGGSIVSKPKKSLGESVEVEKLKAEHKQLLEQLDKYKAQEAYQAKLAKAKQLCESSGIPADLVTPVFLESLASASTEQRQKELVEDRRVLSGKKPTSWGKGGGVELTAEQFKDRLLGRS